MADPAYRNRYTEADAGGVAERVGVRLCEFRRGAGHTQRALGQRLDLAPSNDSRLEAGRHLPSVAMLLRVARELRVPLDRLVARHYSYRRVASPR